MSILSIKTYPDPVLKLKALPVDDFGPSAQAFFDELSETMFIEDGVGLAAPQVGVSKQIIVVAPTMKKGEEIVMVNPVISETSGKEVGSEGCLSLPGLFAEVPRAKKIKLKYQDRYGIEHTEILRDFFARVVQHEVDHLNGILFVDRLDMDTRHKLLASMQEK